MMIQKKGGVAMAATMLTAVSLTVVLSVCARSADTANGNIAATDTLARATAVGSRTEITVEDAWRSGQWRQIARYTSVYDRFGALLSELEEGWSGSTWGSLAKTVHAPDGYHQDTLSVTSLWNPTTGGWVVTQGTRDQIDTTMRSGGRLFMEDAIWDTAARAWVSEDSTVYDSKGRLILYVDREDEYDETARDTVTVVERTENTYRTDGSWIETITSGSSGNASVSVEKSRCRPEDATVGMQCYAIDYWDKEFSEYVNNTARMYRVISDGRIVLDSMVELVENKILPTYVLRVAYDGRALKDLHFWIKEQDDSSGAWNGDRYHLIRWYDQSSSTYRSTDSMFDWQASSSSWHSYQYSSEVRNLSSGFGCMESGIEGDTLGVWSRSRTCDTVLSNGITLTRDYYWTNQWQPVNRFAISRVKDSLVIVEEAQYGTSGVWVPQSKQTVRDGPDGQWSIETEWFHSPGPGQGSWEPAARYRRSRVLSTPSGPQRQGHLRTSPTRGIAVVRSRGANGSAPHARELVVNAMGRRTMVSEVASAISSGVYFAGVRELEP